MVRTLKQHRGACYLSTRELAKKADLSVDTIWRIENGDYQRLRPATMRKIAEVLGVHPSEIAEFVVPAQ